MKNIKFLIASFAIAICAGFSSCTDEYDDSEIWEKVNDLLGRVQKLEAACEQQNSNIAALQTMLSGLKDNIYVTSVEEMEEGIGYVITLSNGESVNIYHGKDGVNGEDGDTPTISVIKDGDIYYWTVNGEILKDEEGNNIPAGSNVSTPILKTGSQLESEGIEGTWDKEAIYVSADNVTWKKIVTGEATQIFTSVEISENEQTVIITLSDGSTITLPKIEKMLAMLYGTWSQNSDWDAEKITMTFNDDNTFEFIIVDGETTVINGSFRFIPDRSIECIGTAGSEQFDFVFNIIEITESTLTVNGSQLLEGTFSRVSNSEPEEDVPADIASVMIGTWTCNVYDEDGSVAETYSITFNEDKKLSIDYDKPVEDTTWSYNEEGELYIRVLHIGGSSLHGTDYTATADNITNPQKFTGNCNLWNFTSNGMYTENTYRKFTLEKSK